MNKLFKSLRSLVPYGMKAPWPGALDEEGIEKALQSAAFKPCGNQDALSIGWVPSLGDPDTAPLLYRGAGADAPFLLTCCIETKKVPTDVLNRRLAEKIKEIEAKESYKPGKKQQRELKEAIVQELLPRVLPRRKHIHVVIDAKDKWVLVGATSISAADPVVEHLIRTFEAFPICPLQTNTAPSAAMAEWILEEPPFEFTVDRECELRSDLEEKPTVHYTRTALDTKEVRDHITEGGMTPTLLALTYADRLSLILTDRTELRKIELLDVVTEECNNAQCSEELFSTEFALMTGEVRKVLGAIVEALDGRKEASDA